MARDLHRGDARCILWISIGFRDRSDGPGRFRKLAFGHEELVREHQGQSLHVQFG